MANRGLQHAPPETLLFIFPQIISLIRELRYPQDAPLKCLRNNKQIEPVNEEKVQVTQNCYTRNHWPSWKRLRD